MRHHDDGLAGGLVNPLQLVLQRRANERVQRPKGFIHEQHIRVTLPIARVHAHTLLLPT